MAAPIVPPPPGLFSMTNGCPTCRETGSTTTRATLPLALPAVNGLIACIARLGHGCGSAAAVAATSATPAMALHKARYIVICTSLDLPEHTAATRSSERTSLALRPLQHRVEELEPLLLQIAQHVFGDGWKGLPDQDVEPERRQRSALERFASRHLLLQGIRSRVLPRDDPETDALERGAGRLWRGQKADAFVIGPGRRVIRLAAGAGGDLLERETPAGHQHAAHLAVEAIAIGDVHCRILRPHDIEARVGEWQIERVALSIGDLVGEPRALREHRGERDEFRREIEAGHLAAELAREIARRPADAAADVENPVGAVDVRKLRQPYGRIAPARMENSSTGARSSGVRCSTSFPAALSAARMTSPSARRL